MIAFHTVAVFVRSDVAVKNYVVVRSNVVEELTYWTGCIYLQFLERHDKESAVFRYMAMGIENSRKVDAPTPNAEVRIPRRAIVGLPQVTLLGFFLAPSMC